MNNLEALLKSRYHGSFNIKGIEFQLLYTALKSFDLFSEDNPIDSLRLEGIEDIDLLGVSTKDEFIQVKTSKDPWKWSQLKGPLKNFLEAIKLDEKLKFKLVVDFPFKSKLARLASYHNLSKKEKTSVKKDFIGLCLELGFDKETAENLLNHITLLSVSRLDLYDALLKAVMVNFNLTSDSVSVYLLALIAKFLEWSKERKTISRHHLDDFRLKLGESLAREASFEAFGRALISNVSWVADENSDDFFAGKSARAGHIANNVDVRREIWLDQINAVFEKGFTCILRSSSGQGKSTLLFRYAFERWPHENIFIINSVGSNEQVSLISEYLRFRHKIGIPSFLLIENAGYKNRFWIELVQFCTSFGIPVLVASRAEDWHRFSQQSLTSFEVIEPFLNLEEAIEIFSRLRANEMSSIHEDIQSAEWAFEEIGSPKLLIEYIYLITHGQLLKERLSDQLQQFNVLDEDPVKKQILRIGALADVCGVPVDINKLAATINFQKDPQESLESLDNEYLRLEESYIYGLHIIRSKHLVEILHRTFPKQINTALLTLPCLPLTSVSTFITNFVDSYDYGDLNEFIKEVAKVCSKYDLKGKLVFIEALFSAGEQIFYNSNEEPFVEAFNKFNASGAKCLSWEFLPMTELNTLSELGKNMERFVTLSDIAKRKKIGNRGIDLARNLIKELLTAISPEDLLLDYELTGKLLDWCSLCEISLPNWNEVNQKLIDNPELFNQDIEKFCRFVFGLFRFDPTMYRVWLESNHRLTVKA